MQIVFHNMLPSGAVADQVRLCVTRLERAYAAIIACRVTVEQRHQEPGHADIFQVYVDVSLPDEVLIADKTLDDAHSHEDSDVAVGDGFKAARRRLDEYARQHRIGRQASR